MASKYQAPRGTRDIFGRNLILFQDLEDSARALFQHYGYSELRLPIFESRELFERSVGADTEIVMKEMYVFSDTKGREFALRPEATASVVRAWIENNLGATGSPTKHYYAGPMFRHERPQAGRYRQFYQIGAELFNAHSIESDLEMVDLAMRFLARLSIDAKLKINHLGCAECKKNLAAEISRQLSARRTELCPDCRTRLDRNPIRILDCKVSQCRAIVADASFLNLCSNCSRDFELFEAGLGSLDISHVKDPRLVRGLDYYTGIVFEATSDLLGAQDAVLGGGRYNGLVEELGGSSTPAVGFAAGMDRLAMLLDKVAGDRLAEPRPYVYVIGLGDQARLPATKLTQMLRRIHEDRARVANARPAWIEQDLQQRSLRSALKVADRQNASYVVILGEDELNAGSVILRAMATGNQTSLVFSDTIRREEFAAAFDDGMARLADAKIDL